MCEHIRTRVKETCGERIGVVSSIFTGDAWRRVEKDVRIKRREKKLAMELIDVLRYKINTSPRGSLYRERNISTAVIKTANQK